MEKAYLVLAGGQVFEGARFGAPVDCVGELVFTTGMGGYIETLTDPSYCGLIAVQTFPQIGNYGMIEEDMESSRCHMRGYIARDICDAPSNFRCEGTLDAFLRAQGVPGLCGVDTRAVTRIIREQGVVNAAITSRVTDDLIPALAAYRVTDALARVSIPAPRTHAPQGEKRLRVALYDYGAKQSIIRALQARGCEVIALPHDTPAARALALGIDGVVLSNGPGDPEDNAGCVAQIERLLGKTPAFGICLGHQMLALAAGAKTQKLKYGHRGENQPVKRLSDGRVFVTSQNHGYAVSDGLPAGAHLSYVNANDGTCEGVEYPALNAFSVQFHPEACAGPLDTASLFDEFIALMARAKE